MPFKAIRTKYQGPGARGARIVARDGDGHRVSIPYPHRVRSGEPAHQKAAQALADKMGWSGRLAGGWLRGDEWVFVFLD